jgi:hypothetical protein
VREHRHRDDEAAAAITAHFHRSDQRTTGPYIFVRKRLIGWDSSGPDVADAGTRPEIVVRIIWSVDPLNFARYFQPWLSSHHLQTRASIHLRQMCL